ncbi:Aste57867_9622 [Aphanomyces stellatus]|uniref:DNA topoisomerase n=1 Tax=Aphanomyces stellatus TaxID=120398 RepID=A0A485KNC4_9STRA|nr:hypothetical protein As57867_009584 [Aphanomyces stellatus]VFT86501.1 Aste57867_9622 [Aphanomyces stellatus]
MRVLNVAEKPSVAKEISAILSQGSCQRRPGFSQYNAIFEFPYQINNQRVDMAFTSVTGHLMELDFAASHRSWKSCDPVELFTAKVEKKVRSDQQNLEKTLRAEAAKAQWLVLWLDCDREGENIAFEVKAVCENVNRRLRVFRARFSALIPRDIQHAVQHLVQPNENLSLACDARSEMDLRLGSAFTRFQTMRIQKKFPRVHAQAGVTESKVVSFGSCQFPTLGFVVDRYLAIDAFVKEPFFYLHATHSIPDVGSIEFSWARSRVYDHLACLALLELCVDAQVATIANITRKDTSKRKPFPLTTVEFQKRASRWLRITSEEAMTAAESLYNKGLLSYPRTETDSFKEGTDVQALLALHATHETWGGYVNQLQHGGKYEHPRAGKHDDQAHPPIHPTKSVPLASLHDKERKVYEFVVLHFLACCSMDARGNQTQVAMTIGGESFSASGLMITARNYLDIYKYEKWATTVIPVYEKGDVFVPTTLALKHGETAPPPLLTESDLIAKMDTHGIGTDATIAEHINTILKREYAIKVNNNTQFKPTELGLALVQSYNKMGYQLAKPDLRAAMERDCTAISHGQKSMADVVNACMEQMRVVFLSVVEKGNVLDETFGTYFGAAVGGRGDPADGGAAALAASRVMASAFSRCGQCGSHSMEWRKAADDSAFLACPQCRKQYALPMHTSLVAAADMCPLCNFQVVEIHKVGSANAYPVCPHCFNHPPNPRLQEMACFNCTAPDCALATGAHAQPVVQFCTHCRAHPMKLKRTKTGKFTVGCTDYPQCKTSVWLPAPVKQASVTTTLCPNCSNVSQMIYRLLLRFQQGALPMDVQARVRDNGDFEACLFCDTVLQDVFQIRLPPPSAAAAGSTRRPVPMASAQLDQSYARVASSSSTTAPTNDYMQSITNPGNTGKKRARANAAPPLPMAGGGPPSADTPAPLCPGHQLPCVSRTTRKEGPNKGRFFFVCPRPQGEQCDFFEWCDQAGAARGSTPPAAAPSGSGGRSRKKAKDNSSPSSGGGVKCSCGNPAVELTSRTANNMGRKFFKCANSDKAQQCDFFEFRLWKLASIFPFCRRDPKSDGRHWRSMRLSEFTDHVWRIGMALTIVGFAVYFREVTVRSFFRFTREQFGRSALLSDVERHFLTSISLAFILLAVFIGVVIAGYGDEDYVLLAIRYAAGIPLVLATRATRIVFTKWLIRTLKWDISTKEDNSRVLIVTEGLGVIFFFIIAVEIFAVYVPTSTTFQDIVFVFFVVLELLCVLSFFSTVLNAVTGFFLIFSEPFRLGSFCAIGASAAGVVEQIALHSTQLRAIDGSVVHIPNSVLATDVQRNFTDCSFRRVNLLVHVAHDTALSRLSLLVHHLKEDLVPCVVPLEDLEDQQERLKRHGNDDNDTTHDDDDASSVLGSLRESKQPSGYLERGLAESAASTDVSDSMFGLEDFLTRSSRPLSAPSTHVDPRLLQVTLGGMHRVWISALVPGNDIRRISEAKSKLNLVIMRALQHHGIRLYQAPRRRR